MLAQSLHLTCTRCPIPSPNEAAPSVADPEELSVRGEISAAASLGCRGSEWSGEARG